MAKLADPPKYRRALDAAHSGGQGTWSTGRTGPLRIRAGRARDGAAGRLNTWWTPSSTARRSRWLRCSALRLELSEKRSSGWPANRRASEEAGECGGSASCSAHGAPGAGSLLKMTLAAGAVFFWPRRSGPAVCRTWCGPRIRPFCVPSYHWYFPGAPVLRALQPRPGRSPARPRESIAPTAPPGTISTVQAPASRSPCSGTRPHGTPRTLSGMTLTGWVLWVWVGGVVVSSSDWLASRAGPAVLRPRRRSTPLIGPGR